MADERQLVTAVAVLKCVPLAVRSFRTQGGVRSNICWRRIARLGVCRYLLQRVGVSKCPRLSVGVFATSVYRGCVCDTHDNRRGQGGPGTGGVAAVVNWRSRVVA